MATYVEIRECLGVEKVNELLRGGEWEFLGMLPGTKTTYIVGRRPKIEEGVGEMILGLVRTSDQSNADGLLRSGKWRLLKVINVQRSSIVGEHVLQDSEVVFVLGCIKP